MLPNTVYVWSSGLEQWEATALIPAKDVCFRYPLHNIRVGTGKLVLEFVHSKRLGAGKLDVFKDHLNRFMGVCV